MPVLEVKISSEQVGVDLAVAYKWGCFVVGLQEGGVAESNGISVGDRLLSVRNDTLGSSGVPMFHSSLPEVQTMLMEADRPFVITFYRPQLQTTSSYEDESENNYLYQLLSCSVKEKAFRSSSIYGGDSNSTLIGIYKALRQVEGVIGSEERPKMGNSS